MLKIIYNAKPFYTQCGGINEPCEKDLQLVFNEDASSVEIIAQFIKVLEFMGYPKQTKTQWLNMIEDLVCDGYLIEDKKEKQERE